ncbi:hypothetical protein DPQ33_17785 [Oceanidesulfovibrio indonesiensis]|uniref:HTH crp-type domain-containing protein n=1 Tax=Oceanidesulfovibrio indonesiensis TaxID=54767 RepID=A0A7M3MAM7_9BACT|nr:helix-turn-helix domain-containing protein [Oceanidesulfovibrio indonesiensis]TVM14164.1 hypothetical protein DPQ33_17785 [Oceanidesulfovibrio indonesiensis]
MARKKIDIPTDRLHALVSSGMTQKEMAQELGISIPTLSRRIADLRMQEGVLRDFREVRALNLTALQARVLEAITPEKIENASLGELAKALKILFDQEQALTGKPTGEFDLAAYLTEIDRRKRSQSN